MLILRFNLRFNYPIIPNEGTSLKMSIKARKTLYDIARSQMGFFTAKQAQSAGYTNNNHSLHVKNGNWIKEDRGVFRLSELPETEHSDLMKWYLWSRDKEGNPQGVFSHLTALEIHQIGNQNSAKYFMIIPRNFRRFNALPKGFTFFKEDLISTDYESFNGLKVTTIEKTIYDIQKSTLFGSEILKDAIEDALRSGKTTKKKLIQTGIKVEE